MRKNMIPCTKEIPHFLKSSMHEKLIHRGREIMKEIQRAVPLQ